VAVLAVSAVGAASASAASFAKPYPNKVEIKGSSYPYTTYFAPTGKQVVLCKENTAKGEITGAKAITATFTFTGCGGWSSAGAKEGEIKTAELAGQPVSINGGKEVGIEFQPKGSGNFAEFSRGSGTEKETLKVRGSVIGVVSPANVTYKEFHLLFSAKSGVQQPSEYTNEKGEKIKSVLEVEGTGKEVFAFEKTGWNLGFGEESTHPDIMTVAEATKVEINVPSRGLPEFAKVGGGSPLGKFEGKAFESQIAYEGATWSYQSATVAGEVIGPNEVAVVLTLREAGTYACRNTESKTLVTHTLIGRLGYINKATKEVGLLFEPILNEPFIGECWGDEDINKITGSIIGKITPVGSYGKTFTLTFRGARGVQELTKFEGEEAIHNLEVYIGTGKGEKASVNVTFELTKSEEMKIVA